jgi:hypothetical protein
MGAIHKSRKKKYLCADVFLIFQEFLVIEKKEEEKGAG